jgi:uncharacterized protein (TIGR04255 family)
VVVGPRLLAVEDRAYQEWDVFSRHVAAARAAVEGLYRPAFYTRVGLRYQDVIRRQMLKEGAEWTYVVKPMFLGLLGAREDEELSPPQEVHSLSRRVAVGTDNFDW